MFPFKQDVCTCYTGWRTDWVIANICLSKKAMVFDYSHQRIKNSSLLQGYS